MQAIIEAPLAGFGLGELDNAGRMNPKRAKPYKFATPYAYTVDFGGEAIDAGTSRTHQLGIQNDADFLVRAVSVSARLVNAASSAIAGTPLPFESEPSSAINQIPTMELIRLELKDADVPWMNAPVPGTHFGGSGRRPGWMLIPPIAGRNNTLQVTMFNDSAVDVYGFVTLIGAKVT